MKLLTYLVLLTMGLAAEGGKRLVATKIEDDIRIDGHLDEPFYRSLSPAGDFVQFHPQNGERPAFPTLLYTFYDKKNLYFAFFCQDDSPDKIAADITPFGQFTDNDEIGVYIDAFSDKRTYEYFGVNPRGVKKGKETIWDADARIVAGGWTAEIAIPFKSLRFPAKSNGCWSVNFRRMIHRLNETDYWTPVSRDQMKIFGDTFAPLEGLGQALGGKNIEIFPYAGVRSSFSGNESDQRLAYGIDLKWGISSNLTLDLTTSPDYSEVESDPFFYQLSPFEFRLQENRPFYLEGQSSFNTVWTLFYSRRITNPTLAAKLTGKENGTAFGVLAATDQAEGEDHFHGVLRLKKDIFKLSSIGFIYSTIEQNGGWNRNVGIDFSFRFKNDFALSGMAALAFNKDRPQTQNGLYRLQFSRSRDRGATFVAIFTRVESNVDVPAGYITDVDRQKIWGIAKYSFRWEGKGVEQLQFLLVPVLETAISSNLPIQKTMEIIVRLSTRKRFTFDIAAFTGHERPRILDPKGNLVWEQPFYPVRGWTFGIDWNGSRRLQFGGYYFHIENFVYQEDFGATRPGWTDDATFWGTFKFSPQLQWSLNAGRSSYQSWDGAIRFSGTILSTSLNWQLSRTISGFVKFQYDSAQERFGYDLLLGWEPANVSKIYLSIKNYSENRFRFFSPDARSVTFKLAYLFRI